MGKSFSVVNVFPNSILANSYAKGKCITLKMLPASNLPQVAMLAKDQMCLRLIPEFTNRNSDLQRLLQLDYSEELLLAIMFGKLLVKRSYYYKNSCYLHTFLILLQK